MHGARTVALGLLALLLCQPVAAQSLRGSKTTMVRQNRVAKDHDYTFLRNDAHVRKFIGLGLLVPIRGNADYELGSVSYPYARPAVKMFVERLASQYRSACGEKLVVTSLTRPLDEQPRNASDLSVHPTGMAVDLRVSNRSKCRSWLERVLLSLEEQGVLDGIRERRPPHYHVALYPSQYETYVARLTDGAVKVADAAPTAATNVAAAAGDGGDGDMTVDYRVKRGESLWSIARHHAVSVDAIQRVNDIRGSRITAGQVLTIPLASGTVADASPAAGVAAAAGDNGDGDMTLDYRVKRGETLWSIARSHGVSVSAIQRVNSMRGSRIKAGQVLTIPIVSEPQ